MQIDAKFIILFFGPIRLERPMSKSRDANLYYEATVMTKIRTIKI